MIIRYLDPWGVVCLLGFTEKAWPPAFIESGGSGRVEGSWPQLTHGLIGIYIYPRIKSGNLEDAKLFWL